MKMLKNNDGVIFDLSEDVKEPFEERFNQYLAEVPTTNFSYEIPTVLPEIQEDRYSTSRSGPAEPQAGKRYFASAATKEKQEVFIGGLSYDITEYDIK